jgi:phosphopentomutase
LNEKEVLNHLTDEKKRVQFLGDIYDLADKYGVSEVPHFIINGFDSNLLNILEMF